MSRRRYATLQIIGSLREADVKLTQGRSRPPNFLLTYEKSHVTTNLSHNLQQPKEESVKKRCVPAQKVLIKFS